VSTQPTTPHPLLAVVTEAFIDRPLDQLLDWLAAAAPEITALEIGSGGYAPHPHCDRELLLASADARLRWAHEIATRGFEVAALNAWGNPLHPDEQTAKEHDRALRETIRLAGALGVERVVAMAGCPAARPGERTPHFAAGGWLPYLEHIYETQFDHAVAPYWAALSEFARAEHPGLLICVELHPGSSVYNHETFARFCQLGSNLAANIDPSHFFWQRIDTQALIAQLPGPIGHAHAKDVSFNEEVLARNGLLDHRWPGPSADSPWSFATVGRGHDGAWWGDFMTWLEPTAVKAVAIEHEDPDIAPEVGVVEAARLLQGTSER
jgi:sugar phosphate isomerase/epimerase